MCNFSREDEVLNYLKRVKKEVMLFFFKNHIFLYKKTRVNESIVKNFNKKNIYFYAFLGNRATNLTNILIALFSNF